MTIVRFFLMASFIPNFSLATAGGKFVSGKFKVASISPAVINCNIPEFKKRKTKAPGCILKLKTLASEKYGQALPQEISYYSEEGNCNQTVGKIVDLNISKYCPVRKISGCDPEEPKHSNAMWGCTLKSWYNTEKHQLNEYPEDSILMFRDERQQERIHNWKGKEK